MRPKSGGASAFTGRKKTRYSRILGWPTERNEYIVFCKEYIQDGKGK